MAILRYLERQISSRLAALEASFRCPVALLLRREMLDGAEAKKYYARR